MGKKLSWEKKLLVGKFVMEIFHVEIFHCGKFHHGKKSVVGKFLVGKLPFWEISFSEIAFLTLISTPSYLPNSEPPPQATRNFISIITIMVSGPTNPIRSINTILLLDPLPNSDTPDYDQNPCENPWQAP